MKEGMKVLIAYDGSAHADAALADLRRAGLPREAEALLVSVADGLVGAYLPVAEIAGPAAMSSRVTSVVELAREQAVMLLAEARQAVGRASSQVVSTFPGWEVRSAVLEGDPSEELLKRAEEWRPDLIVVGSQGADDVELVRDEEMTDAEWRVAEAVARGLSNKEIAAELNLSLRTIEGHISRILDKKSLSNRVELALHVREHKQQD